MGRSGPENQGGVKSDQSAVMAFFNFFFPRKISFPDSHFNRRLLVVDYGTSATLFADGLIESGSIMSQIWQTGLKKLLPSDFVPQSVLLLGLAGGSNATLISRRYPEARITGVDIDPVMIEIGQKYFGLKKIKNLSLVIADAFTFVHHLPPETQYDLVLLDCFIGQQIPSRMEDLDFLHRLRTHSRFLLINHLWWHEHRSASQRFLNSLATRFFFIKVHTRTNMVVSLV